MTGKVVVVTGGNGGIGFWTCQQLAQAGATMVLACRSMERADAAIASMRAEVPAGDFAVVRLDLADLASVRDAAAELCSRYDRLDVLVNNAGIALVPKARTRDGFESQFGANFLGHFALTGQVLNLLEATPDSRVVHVGSIAQRLGRIRFNDPNFERRRYGRWGAYSQSKLANVMFMLELQRRLAAAGSQTRSLGAHPGAAFTGIIDQLPLMKLRSAQAAGDWVGRTFFNTPERSADAPVFAASDPELAGGSYYGPGGWTEIKGPLAPARISARGRSETDAARLWSIAEELTGVRYLSR